MDGVDRARVGYGKRIAIDEALHHRVLARRNWTLGLWAASLIGLEEADARSLAGILVDEEPDDDVIAKALGAEFLRAHVEVSERRIRRRMEEDFTRAEADVLAGRAPAAR